MATEHCYICGRWNDPTGGTDAHSGGCPNTGKRYDGTPAQDDRHFETLDHCDCRMPRCPWCARDTRCHVTAAETGKRYDGTPAWAYASGCDTPDCCAGLADHDIAPIYSPEIDDMTCGTCGHTVFCGAYDVTDDDYYDAHSRGLHVTAERGCGYCADSEQDAILREYHVTGAHDDYACTACPDCTDLMEG